MASARARPYHRRVKRLFFFLAGWLSLGLGTLGIFLPLLPTVPFAILAAFCFARSSPRLEHWLVMHPRFGHHIRDWRAQGAISRKGKRAALIAFAVSALVSLFTLSWPWILFPLGAMAGGATFVFTRPEPVPKD